MDEPLPTCPSSQTLGPSRCQTCNNIALLNAVKSIEKKHCVSFSSHWLFSASGGVLIYCFIILEEPREVIIGVIQVFKSGFVL